MNHTPKQYRSGLIGVVTLAGLSISFALAGPATAAGPSSNSSGQCLATPSRLVTTNHDATFRDVTTVTPGKDREFHQEYRWSRQVPAIEEIKHEETQYSRVIPGANEVKGERWKYSRVIPGFSDAWFYQYTRTNPGHGESKLKEYKYSKQVPPILETKYKKPVIGIEYQYKKYVQGKILVKQSGYWVETGETFPWEVWSGNLTQWSTQNKNVLESGNHSAVVAEWSVQGKQYRKVSTHYQYQNTGQTRQVNTGQFEYGWFTSNPGSPWVSTGQTQVKTPGYTEYYNNGNWTKDTLGAPWVKTNQRQVDNPNYVAPFTEYRAQDGSPTTDVNNAGWFTEPIVDGWNAYGLPKKEAVPDPSKDATVYLTGNSGESTNMADAAWFESNNGVGLEWVEFGRETFTKEEAIPDKTVYLTVSEEGVAGETEDRSEASWIDTSNPDRLDLSIWQQMVDEFGNPLVQEVIDRKFEAGYTVYYVPGGEPITVLGESSWTTDVPPGWTKVDDREVETKQAILPVSTVSKVLDKAAWVESTTVPATYKACGHLAETGSDPAGLAGLAGLLALGGAAGVVVARKRGRHVADTPIDS